MIHIAIFFQQLIASLTHIIAKGVTNDVSPVMVLFFRAFIASMVYFIYLLFRKSGFKKIENKDWWLIFVLGLLNIPINQFFFLVGVSFTTAPNVSLAYALTPIFVFIVAAIFYKEKVNTKKIMGIILAVGGAVVLLSEKGFSFTSDSLKGDILALLASLSWGLYTIIGRDFSRKYGAIYSTFLSMAAGFILYIPVFLSFEHEYNVSEITFANWLQILYLGAITSGLGYALWFYALKKIEASKLSVFNNFQPALTAILAFLIFGTGISLYFLVGGTLIIAGVFITQRG
ncbi:DMT family transporter [Candidatus Kapaibacterium sp.]